MAAMSVSTMSVSTMSTMAVSTVSMSVSTVPVTMGMGSHHRTGVHGVGMGHGLGVSARG